MQRRRQRHRQQQLITVIIVQTLASTHRSGTSMLVRKEEATREHNYTLVSYI
jgi:hypothetical protein